MTQTSAFEYPKLKTKYAPERPRYVDLDLWESDQLQEGWAWEGSVGPEVFYYLDGTLVSWWPCVTMERAQRLVLNAN